MVSFNVAANYLINGAVEVDRDMYDAEEDPALRLSGGIEKHSPAYLNREKISQLCEIKVKPDVYKMLNQKTETHDEFVTRMLKENSDQH